MKFVVSAIVAAILSGPAFAAAAEKQVSIVLVHGAFVDAAGWKEVYNILTKQGYEVLVVQNPTISLRGDVDITNRVIAKAKYPVVLVGHSYGGAVITDAGDNPKVKSLVYISAFAPEIGESVFELATAPAPGEDGPPLLPPSDGFLLVDQEKFPQAFAAGVDEETTRFMAAAQVPWGLEAVQTKATKAAWKSKPSFFLVTTKDHMIQPSKLRSMAKRAGGRTVEIDSSHAVMLTYPDKVAALIESAAR